MKPACDRIMFSSARPLPKFALMLVAFLTILCLQPALAQTFSVIHSFTGGGDGFQPYAGVTIDHGGNLYGTTSEFTADPPGGTVFQMKYKSGAWTLKTLSNFDIVGGGPLLPEGRVVFGPGGALYGTTFYGGQGFCTELGCGSVYLLQPSGNVCSTFNCPWNITSEYSFQGPPGDGFSPSFVDPVFDSAGNLYGTTTEGGEDVGNVFMLVRSNGQWTQTSIHNFSGSDGMYPQSGVTLDAQGNLYGTAWMGGPNGFGAVYKLTRSGGSWTEETLYGFPNSSDGQYPVGGLVFDEQGNLYGTTYSGGVNGGGTVFELSPSGGGWNFSVIYSFAGQGRNPGPFDTLTIDSAGNLYGTTYADGAFGDGSVFKLTKDNGSWTFTDLHDFTNGNDGGNPIGGVTLDANGNLYGTTSGGGSPHQDCNGTCGVVWEIKP